jgi:hypothetical protein
LEKGSKIRRQKCIALQNEGDFIHNYSVLEKRSGCIIPKYRTKGSCADDYLACHLCKGLYQRKLISVHEKNCSLNPKKSAPAKKGQAAKLGREMLPIPLDVSSSFYQRVLSSQRDDEVSQLIRHDSLLLEYGQRLYGRRDAEEHTAGQVSCRMRELGRLVKLVRQRSQMRIPDLYSLINAAHFDQLVEAVKELAEFNEDTHQFKKGHLAMRIGNALKKCSQIKQSGLAKKLATGKSARLEAELEETQRFDSVFTGDWYDCVSATASQSVGRMTMNKPKLIPSCEDVTKVQELLKSRLDSNDYTTLVKATLCAVSLFNRKRGGELQRMKVADFEDAKCGGETNKDILRGLTPVEKKMVNHFQRVEIRGKFNRKVPILLTKTMKKAMERILILRTTVAGVADSPYMFATPTGQRPFRGHDVLKTYALEAKVSNPAIFTFTQLRKQLATLAQAMAISELDQDQLADFLGHDIRIHRHIYRQPQEILQKAKVAKILMAINKNMSDFDTCIREELSDAEIDFDDDEEVSETCNSALRKETHHTSITSESGNKAAT